MATEDWIQESLARLESLEEERNRHEAALETATDPAALRMNAQAIERLDAKIKSLYAELEAAAEQSESEGEVETDDVDEAPDEPRSMDESTRLFRREDAATPAVMAAAARPAAAQAAPSVKPMAAAAVAAAAPQPMAASAAPVSTPFAAPTASPFGAPAATPTAPAAAPFGGAPAASPFGGAGGAGGGSPFGEVPAAAPFGGSSESPGFSAAPSMSTSFDAGNSLDDESSGGSGSKTGIIIGVVVIVLGLGAYLAMGRKSEEPPPPVPAGPEKVIRAGEVPPDTQGPKTVKGSDVDSIKGTQFKEGTRPSGGGGGGGSNTPAAEKPKKKDPRAKIESTDDPLAGIDK